MDRTARCWAVLVLVLSLAISTDYYDGYFARKFDVKTKSGSYLDPLADKALVLSMYSAFAVIGTVPWFLVWCIALRDFAVTCARSWLLARGRPLQTSIFAKIKTAVQFAALYPRLLLQVWPIAGRDYCIDAIVVVVALLTIVSGCAYLPAVRFGWRGGSKR